MSFIHSITSGLATMYHTYAQPKIKRCVNWAKSAYLRHAPRIVYSTICYVGMVSAAAALQSSEDSAGSYQLASRSIAAMSGCVAYRFWNKAQTIIQIESRIQKDLAKIRQFEAAFNEAAPDQAPLVVVLRCESDHNQAFSAEFMEPAYRLMKGICRLQIVPIAGPHEIEEQYATVATTSTIADSILAGHGNTDLIVFREDHLFGSRLGKLTLPDVTPQMFEKVKGTIVCEACLTGERDGIASRIAQVSKCRVEAPFESALAKYTRIWRAPSGKLAFISFGGELASNVMIYEDDLSTFDFERHSNKEFLLQLKEKAADSDDPAALTFVGYSFIDIGEIELGKECLQQASSCQKGIDSDLLRIQSKIQKKILRLTESTI